MTTVLAPFGVPRYDYPLLRRDFAQRVIDRLEGCVPFFLVDRVISVTARDRPFDLAYLDPVARCQWRIKEFKAV